MFVHVGIGQPHQRFQGIGLGGVQRQPHTHGGVQVYAFKMVGFASDGFQHTAEPLSGNAPLADAVQDSDELVAAQPDQRARRRQGALEPFREPVQQLVAAIMAVRVVDLLEIVQIHVTESAKGRFASIAFSSSRNKTRRLGSPVRGSCSDINSSRFF